MKQRQFLQVVSRDEAARRLREAFPPAAQPAEPVALEAALGRVLAAEIVAPIDVPGFSRSDMDGFAVRAESTFGAGEESPRTLRLRC